MYSIAMVTVYILISLMIGGCSSEEGAVTAETSKSATVSAAEFNNAEQHVLYENEEAGIVIMESGEWNLEKEVTNPFNAVFENGRIKAIITVISNDLSNSEIKQQLKNGAGNVSVIEDDENYISFHTGRTESIRSDIYIHEDFSNKRIVTFMTPDHEYFENKEQIAKFKESIQFY